MKRVEKILDLTIRLCFRIPTLALCSAGFLIKSLKKGPRKIIRKHPGWKKNIRVQFIRESLRNLIYVLDSFSFDGSILITRDKEVCVIIDGISLSVEGTRRYLKKTVNEGKELLSFIMEKGVTDIKSVIDVGANFGEVSLYFAKRFPEAKIIAIEPSTENYRILKKNIMRQTFKLDNVIVEKMAVSDKKGTVNLTTGLYSENTMVLGEENNAHVKNFVTETVNADTLGNILKKHEIDDLDFLKIDIEGAEPLLLDDIKARSKKIKTIYVELGRKIGYKKYIPFIECLYSEKFTAYVDKYTKFNTCEEALNYYENFKKNNEGRSINYWFINKLV